MARTSRLNLIKDLALRKGATFRHLYTVLQDNGAPFDLTGCTAIAQIRKRPDLPAVAAFTLNFQEPRINGVILLSIIPPLTTRSDRYLWDLRLTLANGDIWVPVEGLADIRETISHGTPPDPLPGGDGGSPGLMTVEYERTFTQADLSIAGILPVTHGLNTNPSAIALYNSSGMEVRWDDVVIVNANAIAIHLESYIPITGTWTLSIGV